MVKTLTSRVGSAGSIPGWGPKIPQECGQKDQNIKQKQYSSKINKDFLKKKKG